jgi:hypothetical protein
VACCGTFIGLGASSKIAHVLFKGRAGIGSHPSSVDTQNRPLMDT